MKKTLIALMALAGVAMAAPNDLGITTGANFYAGDYAFTFKVAENQLSADDTSDVLGLYYGSFDSAAYCSNGFVLNYNVESGAITLSVGRGSMGTVGTAQNPSITESTTFSINGDGVSGGTFDTTLVVGQTYTVINVMGTGDNTSNVSLYAGSLNYNTDGWYSWTEVDGSAVQVPAVALATVSYKGNMNGGNAGTTMVSVGNSAYDIQVIPEPATATLSLLALAGLAARRRRK